VADLFRVTRFVGPIYVKVLILLRIVCVVVFFVLLNVWVVSVFESLSQVFTLWIVFIPLFAQELLAFVCIFVFNSMGRQAYEAELEQVTRTQEIDRMSSRMLLLLFVCLFVCLFVVVICLFFCFFVCLFIIIIIIIVVVVAKNRDLTTIGVAQGSRKVTCGIGYFGWFLR
jgi:hypothetical protein